MALYEATGVAWYYVLDTENKRFKLPREDKDGEYLYFYVGNFEQSAIEQTAGITSEQLNQKVDLDLGNLTLEAKSAIVAMGMPDYSAGVYISNATIKAGFTAPSPGYLVSTAGWATLTINGNSLPNGAFTFSNDSSSLQQIFIPLDSGDVLVGTGAYKTDSSRFFPVKGVQ